jgi:hypothetical protein
MPISTRAEPVTPTLLRGWPLPGGGSGKDDRGSGLGYLARELTEELPPLMMELDT